MLVNSNIPAAGEIPRVQESEIHTQYRRLIERKMREEEGYTDLYHVILISGIEKGVIDVVRQGISGIYSGFWSIWHYIGNIIMIKKN